MSRVKAHDLPLVVVLLDPFRGMSAWGTPRRSNRQSGHAQRSGPEVKNGSSAKNCTNV